MYIPHFNWIILQSKISLNIWCIVVLIVTPHVRDYIHCVNNETDYTKKNFIWKLILYQSENGNRETRKKYANFPNFHVWKLKPFLLEVFSQPSIFSYYDVLSSWNWLKIDQWNIYSKEFLGIFVLYTLIWEIWLFH